MSIFGSIASAIFGHPHAAGGSPTPAPTSARPTPSTAATPISEADLEAKIEQIADSQNEDLDWKRSIVDLMEVLKLDSSRSARKQLAHELGYRYRRLG